MQADVQGLLRRIQQGDEAALAVAYARYGRAVYSLTLHVLHNAILAQEATQDTFMKLWNNPTAYDSSKGEFSSWLLTMARYTAIDHLRREMRRTGRNVDLLETLATEDEERLSESEAGQLHALLGELPRDQRILVEMAFFQGLTHSQLAERMDLPIGTVKTRLRLGLQKLRGLLIRKS
jgi:RNA polymerase sigma-70 factor (ECF subfamily)